MKKTNWLRLLALMLALALTVSLVACDGESPLGTTDGDDPPIQPGGDAYAALEYFLGEIYAVGGYSDMLTDMLNAPPSTEDTFYNHLVTSRITEENETYFLGSDSLVYDAAIASDPAMSPTLYSLCLLVAETEDQAETLATELKKSANPMKWVCTGLADDDVYVARSGCYVILVMSARDGEKLISAFHEVVGGVTITTAVPCDR